MNALSSLLAARPWLLADGATGTNLFDMGLMSGDAPELWNVDHPGKIAALHRAFVEAGADIILTNTFGCNGRRLMLHGAQARTQELNQRGAEIARGVADAAERVVVVAGSVGPTGDLLVPLGALTEAEACAVFVEQMQGLKAGGADVAWIETMSALEEIRAAVKAAGIVGLPCVVTASFDTAGRTMMGTTPGDFAGFFAGLDVPPLAIGSNCGVGASDLLASVLGLTAAGPDRVVVAKANAGIPTVHGDHTHYSGTPELMADYARMARDAGARIIGGCCGTTPGHIRAMRAALEAHEVAHRPEIAEVVARIGRLVSPPPADQSERPVRETRRRR